MRFVEQIYTYVTLLCDFVMEYATPDVLVTTQWVWDHCNDPKVRIVEVDYDPTANYELGHIPEAVLWDWRKDLNEPVMRDILSKEQLEQLLSRSGISPDVKIVLYGDYDNWFAAYAFWDLAYYGVRNTYLMDGGRKKWFIEDRPLTKDTPNYPITRYTVPGSNHELRVYLNQVRDAVVKHDKILVDVRSPKEFTGEITAPPEYPQEHAQRGGHIPRAINVPWAQAVNEDGTFKSADELGRLYKSNGVTPDREVITYCRIGERSSHTWFVLKYLLGYPKVRNYDGSWTEYGNMVGNTIEKP